MFQCNKMILEVPSESFNKGHVTSLQILVRLVYFYLTYSTPDT